MCLQTVRRHICRHCHAEWNHSDGLELCPEGDKEVMKHGYCAPVSQILERGGHHVSRACVPDHHHHQHQHHHHHHQAAAVPVGSGATHIYTGHHGAPTTSVAAAAAASSLGNAMGAPDVPALIEDMCDDCKEKHFREWAVEAKVRQEQQQQQRLLQQQQAQQALQQAEQAQHQLNGV